MAYYGSPDRNWSVNPQPVRSTSRHSKHDLPTYEIYSASYVSSNSVHTPEVGQEYSDDMKRLCTLLDRNRVQALFSVLRTEHSQRLTVIHASARMPCSNVFPTQQTANRSHTAFHLSKALSY